MPELFRSHCLLLLITFIAGAGLSHAGDGQLRIAKDDAELRAWLENMLWHHRYSMEEMEQVTGLNATQLTAQLSKFNISDGNRPPRIANQLLMLPYPGGRHPRIGFLDGAVEPQRETKLSVFCPWDDHSYVVMDVPEAIWSNLGLTYLAHTHVKTIWDLQGMPLEQQEWLHADDSSFQMQRRLPNGIEFGTTAKALPDHIAMTMFRGRALLVRAGEEHPPARIRGQLHAAAFRRPEAPAVSLPHRHGGAARRPAFLSRQPQAGHQPRVGRGHRALVQRRPAGEAQGRDEG